MTNYDVVTNVIRYTHGRRLRGTGGTVPPYLKWGDGPCIRPPSSVIGSVTKYELSKKWFQGGNFCSELDVLRQEKGHICYI